jgi:general stress protein 26
MAMELSEIYSFVQTERLAVLSTCAVGGQPESALVGFAASPSLEIVFDTVKSSRKYPILKSNPRVALVIGCATEVTVQYEGTAEELDDAEDGKYLQIYYAVYPDGRARRSWPGIVYFVVRPKWVRYCDYNPGRRRIEEISFKF